MFLFLRFTLPGALVVNAFPFVVNTDLLRSILIAVGGAGAAYSGWRLRAFAIEKANADALQRRVEVLEHEVTDERGHRVEAEKEILVKEGELKALEARPDYQAIHGLVTEQGIAALARQTELAEMLAKVAEMLERLSSGQERIVAALNHALERRESIDRGAK